MGADSFGGRVRVDNLRDLAGIQMTWVRNKRDVEIRYAEQHEGNNEKEIIKSWLLALKDTKKLLLDQVSDIT